MDPHLDPVEFCNGESITCVLIFDIFTLYISDLSRGKRIRVLPGFVLFSFYNIKNIIYLYKMH